MANMLDYIDWRGDLTFDKAPFNDIDNLIFTQLSFIDFENIVTGEDETGFIKLSEASDKFFKKHINTQIDMGVLVPDTIVTLLKKMSEAPRYKDLLLTKYVNRIDYEKSQQFAALTILLPDDTFVIAFRGTDDTIVGWKEDFNMSFMTTVPSQLDAVKYVEKVSSALDKKFRICGHSKGGNLSVYSAVNCQDAIKDRIIQVYNNDGPGFSKKILDSENYIKIADRIKTIIPESSVVGILLEHDEKFMIVKSTQSGLFQHDSFSWQLMGREFIIAEERTPYSEISDAALKTWLAELDMNERMLFVDTFFNVLESSNAKTLLDLDTNKLESANAMLKTIKNLDDEKRIKMTKLFASLFKFNVRAAIDTVLKPKEKIHEVKPQSDKRNLKLNKKKLSAKKNFKKVSKKKDIKKYISINTK